VAEKLMFPGRRTKMIERYAVVFAKANVLPKSEAEFAQFLYDFGYTLNSGLEKMIDHALSVQAQMAELSTFTFSSPRISEVPRDEQG
jgi:hypothetical protein